MSIAVFYEPVQYTFDGVWFCDHIGDTKTITNTVDSLNFAGEHYTYEEEVEVCANCNEEMEW